MDTCFATAVYASKVAIHCTLNISPGALVPQRDMILNIPLITHLLQLHERWQIIIDEQLQCAYLSRKTFDYQSGDEILSLTNNPSTLQDHGIGTFTIIQVHTMVQLHFKTHHILGRFWLREIPFLWGYQPKLIT